MIRNIKILILLSFTVLSAQQKDKLIISGKVEYVSSQFTYVSFINTEGINIGDTLFTKINTGFIPKLIVHSKSSRSCAAKEIKGKLQKGIEIFAYNKIENEKLLITKNDEKNNLVNVDSEEVKPIEVKNSSKYKSEKDNFYGRFNLSSYSNLSNNSNGEDYQKWRYSFNLNANDINNSGLSFSNYITFRYRADEWSYTTNHLNDAVKIYDLAVSYELKKTKFTLGRKINTNIANVGAIDGLQIETNYNSFSIGGVIGSRPNFNDYGYNINLLQLGGFISRKDSLGNGEMQNTISAFQLMNNNSTDRRFFYLQHSNNIINNLGLFFSTEIDLFKYENNKASNDFRLTSFYVSARFSPVRWLSATASYDARKNVIYYETFKNYADQLIESALRQGFRLRLNIRPLNNIFVSLNSGYRFSEDDAKPSNNYGISVTHSRIQYLNLSANINYLGLNTMYLNGDIIGLRLSKDLLDGALYGTLSYRNINYKFINTESKLIQDIFSADLSLRINKSLTLSLSFEGTYEGKTSYSNIYTNFSWRF
ncbi:MAG: hypothetical protein IPH62_05280 [Ignavibacteriae bacterium]|nr:hypothetical protein [Ignavibacteriota bacterium]